MASTRTLFREGGKHDGDRDGNDTPNDQDFLDLLVVDGLCNGSKQTDVSSRAREFLELGWTWTAHLDIGIFYNALGTYQNKTLSAPKSHVPT